jgi:hypothetical protein
MTTIVFALTGAIFAVGQDCVATLVGPSIDLSSQPTTQRRDARAAYNSVDDEYLAVWFDSRNPGQNDVFGQRLSAGGALLGDNIAIRIDPGSQTQPSVAYNSTDNEYLATWKTQRAGPGSQFFNNTFGQRLAADGSLIDIEFHISNGGLEGSLVYNPIANEFMHEARNFAGGGAAGIRGQRISNSGSLLGVNFTISSGGAPAGQIAYDGNSNQYLGTWRDQNSRNLQGRLISASGTLIGGPILISPTFPTSGSAAAAAFDAANDRYLVVFGTFSSGEVLGQFVAGDGALIGGNFPIAVGLSAQAVPVVAYDPDDRVYCVAWKQGGDIVGQLLHDDASLSGTAFTIAASTASGRPAATYNSANGEFLLVWADDRNLAAGEQDIFAQRIAVSCGCPGDLNGDGITDLADLGILLADFGCVAPGPCVGDLDNDGDTDLADLGILLADFGCAP